MSGNHQQAAKQLFNQIRDECATLRIGGTFFGWNIRFYPGRKTEKDLIDSIARVLTMEIPNESIRAYIKLKQDRCDEEIRLIEFLTPYLAFMDIVALTGFIMGVSILDKIMSPALQLEIEELVMSLKSKQVEQIILQEIQNYIGYTYQQESLLKSWIKNYIKPLYMTHLLVAGLSKKSKYFNGITFILLRLDLLTVIGLIVSINMLKKLVSLVDSPLELEEQVMSLESKKAEKALLEAMYNQDSLLKEYWIKDCIKSFYITHILIAKFLRIPKYFNGVTSVLLTLDNTLHIMPYYKAFEMVNQVFFNLIMTPNHPKYSAHFGETWSLILREPNFLKIINQMLETGHANQVIAVLRDYISTFAISIEENGIHTPAIAQTQRLLF
jgi:hypothetical protein